MENNREKLLAEAKELGLELPADATDEQIQATIDEKLAEGGEENTTTTPEGDNEDTADEGESTSVIDDEVTPAEPEQPTEPEKSPEEIEAENKAREAREAAARKEEEDAQALIDEQKRLEEEAKAEKPSEGSEIAAAIREGLSANKEDKRIKITSDKHVKSMFSVVRSKKTGEMMIRENSNGVLSKVQLKSLEEKEADLQHEEYEEV